MIKSLLDAVSAELALLSRVGGQDNPKKAMVARADCTLSPEQAENFRERLVALLEETKAEGKRGLARSGRPRAAADSYSLVVAFYPSPSLPRPADEKPARRRASKS
jgi:hypothetical protein